MHKTEHYIITELLLLCSTNSITFRENLPAMAAVSGKMVAEAALEAVFQGVAQLLGPSMVKWFALRWGVEEEAKKLLRTLMRIQALLEDAEQRQMKEVMVRLWLRELKDTVYDAEDLIDDMATEKLRLEAEGGGNHGEVRQFSPLASLTNIVAKIEKVSFNVAVGTKLKDVLKRLDEIAKDGDALGLKRGHGWGHVRARARRQTSSLLDESDVIGREDDKKKIISLLLSDDSNGRNFSVVPIVGMGGLGKTTLAQLIYNDQRVENHFQVRVWVCEYGDFDVERLTREILESASGFEICDQIKGLNMLQIKLKEQLEGKRFLLVIDDLWNESHQDWERLKTPFIHGAKGSKILLTTRSGKVSRITATVPAHHLKGLSEEDCWSLFKQRAFGEGWSNVHPKLEAIGKEIVKKCHRLPLAVKSLGGLLNSTLGEDEWFSILTSELWDLLDKDDDILPALKLSYHHLPPHLKQCFVFCSVYPKDFQFDKDKLVLWWMALGFIGQKGRRRIEDVGCEYFDDLLSRSFFQISFYSDDNRPRYIMHNLIHDLAQSIADGECLTIEADRPYNISDRIRYSYLACKNLEPSILSKSLASSKGLRSFQLSPERSSSFELDQIISDTFRTFRCIRLLDLSNSGIVSLPSSIGNLKHLRYLDLSKNCIKRLPESIGSLYNLQTLKLKQCSELLELPKGMRNLIKLRHLDLDSYLYESISITGIGRLTCLQTLPAFVVGVESGHRIDELRNMVNLRGRLLISKLENTTDAAEAKNAQLKNKCYVRSLELQWTSDVSNLLVQEVEKVLECLKPHKSLKQLRIDNYHGVRFPSWIEDPSFSYLASIELSNCRKCKILPPLGKLPHLRNLHVSGMYSLKRVGREFCGDGSVIKAFPSLEQLSFHSMRNWEEWCDIEEGELRCLRVLRIHYCPKLERLPYLPPTLQHISFSGCGKMKLNTLA